MPPVSRSPLQRLLMPFSKAILAYINAGDLERAKEQLQLCPPAEAATQYLSFLIAVNLGRELAGECRR